MSDLLAQSSTAGHNDFRDADRLPTMLWAGDAIGVELREAEDITAATLRRSAGRSAASAKLCPSWNPLIKSRRRPQTATRFTAAIVSRPRSYLTLCGSISVFPSAWGWSRTCWRHEGLLSRTRQSDCGQRGSAALLPARSAAAQPVGCETSVTSTQSSFRSAEGSTGSGASSIRTVSSWRLRCKAAATPRRQSV